VEIMNRILCVLIVFAFVAGTEAQEVERDIPYADPAHERQVLDVYSPRDARNLPVVFWIHGGGWQTGDKSSVQLKPRVFTERGFVFVSTNKVYGDRPNTLPLIELDTRWEVSDESLETLRASKAVANLPNASTTCPAGS
jgi:hypothetical protein